MTWDKELPVSGGDLWIRSTDEEDVYSTEGVVASGKEYLIWFQRLRCPDTGGHLLGLSLPYKYPIAAHSAEAPCTLSLGPRLQPVEGPQPTSFLALCERLLAPLPQEKWHGYVCTLSLRIGASTPINGVIQDSFHGGHEADFVEFMHMQEPLTLIAHRERRSFTSREMVELVLSLMRGWPLQNEANN